MKTPLDCLPCFMGQILRGLRMLAPDREDIHAERIKKLIRMMQDYDLAKPPTTHTGEIYALLTDLADNGDPFYDEKKDSNDKVLSMLPQLSKIVDNNEDPIKAALELAIIGNYIDAGAAVDIDWEKALFEENQVLDQDNLKHFKSRARDGAKVLILGDNAGEIALDTLLVQRLRDNGAEVTYTVRSKPIINDATMADAEYVGMTDLCEVVESGVDTAGTVLEKVTPEFYQRMRDADVILSKGQGNFESLYNEWPDIFYGFKVKCRVISRITGKDKLTSVFLHQAETEQE